MTRKLPERWHIKVCPGCNGIVEGISQTHLGDCEYRNKIFVPRSVEVSPVPRAFPEPDRSLLPSVDDLDLTNEDFGV